MSCAITCSMALTSSHTHPVPTLAESPGSVDPTVDAIERILVGGVGLTSRALAEVAEAADLTLAQWRVLVILADGGGLRIGALAIRLGIAEPSASRLVRRLERHGLLTAVRDDQDRRATNARLTEEGRRIRGIVLDRRRDLIVDATERARSGISEEASRQLSLVADALAQFA
jgi:DNA-binding MarR family transcriptional regulator